MIEAKAKKDSAFKAYLKKIFTKKQIITKLIILAIACVIVCVPASIFYGVWANNDQFTWSGPIIGIRIVWNTGIATSAMAGNYAGIYAIQSLVFIILLLVFWFLTQDKVSCAFVALAVFGGLFNLIQRAAQAGVHANCVFDYLYFSAKWLQWMSLGDTTFNWPDMGVVIGIIGFIISYIIHIILQVKHDKSKDDEIIKKAQAYEKIADTVKETETK